MESVGITNLCRICEQKTNFVDLSHPDHQSYLEQFLSCANVTFQMDDKLPKNICETCVTELNHAYRFKQKCEESQKKFEELLASAEMAMSCETIKIEHIDICELYINDYNSYSEDDHKINDIQNETAKRKTKHTNLRDTNPKYNDHINGNKRKSSLKKPINNVKRQKRLYFLCDICKKKYYTKNGIRKHLILSHKMSNLYTCWYCGKCFTSRKFKEHIKAHENPYICEFCSLSFSSLHNLQRHVNAVHHKLKEFICEICEKKFAQKSSLTTHMEVVHVGQFNYICDKCGKSFKSNAGLFLHKLTHLSKDEKRLRKLKPYQCDICNKSHKTQDELNLHREHKILCKKIIKNDQKYNCQYCRKTFATKTQIFLHQKTHSEYKPYKCIICEKCFKQRGTLVSHERAHNNVRLYKCDYCNMRFVQSHQVKSHMSTHTGEKPYECEFCKRAFAQKQQLKTHTRTHTGEKPFECEFCKKTFAIKYNCIAHRRLHTGEKPFNCEKCPEKFIDLNGLKRHRNKFHLNE